MVDCPRCGFTQPKDQFCANCGVNMEAYQPAPKPITQKFASNTYVIGGLIAVILVSMIWYLQMKNQETEGSGENTITRDEAFEVERQQELERAEAKRREKVAERQREKQRVQQQAQAMAKVRSSEDTPKDAVAPQSESTAGSAMAPQKLQLRFYEVSSTALDQLYSSGQVLSETSSSRTLVIENVDSVTKALASAKNLGAAKTWSLRPGETLSANFGNIGDELKAVNYDLNFELIVNRVSAEGVSYQFRGDFYFAEEEQTPLTLELSSETHQIGRQGAIAIVGFIPHNLVGEETSTELLKAPLKIMGSPDFMEGAESPTEFVIVITPQ